MGAVVGTAGTEALIGTLGITGTGELRGLESPTIPAAATPGGFK
jgi:hypothetical protein